MKKRYRIGAPEGAEWIGSEAVVGDEVELDLQEEQERALIAAGWLEPVAKKGKEE